MTEKKRDWEEVSGRTDQGMTEELKVASEDGGKRGGGEGHKMG